MPPCVFGVLGLRLKSFQVNLHLADLVLELSISFFNLGYPLWIFFQKLLDLDGVLLIDAQLVSQHLDGQTGHRIARGNRLGDRWCKGLE